MPRIVLYLWRDISLIRLRTRYRLKLKRYQTEVFLGDFFLTGLDTDVDELIDLAYFGANCHFLSKKLENHAQNRLAMY